jgi:tetratricopeptide (TPR) repeat protein
MNQMEWKSRILFGFSRTALALDKPELAIASLQEATQVDPKNPEIFRTLSEAFCAAELSNEALKVAHITKQLAPDDVEMLIWYANILTKLNKSQDAIPALTRAIELSPNQPALLIQLAKVQSLAGEDKFAADTYTRILTTENPGAYELLEAGQGLNQLNDFINAIACLELGLEKLSEPTPEFLTQLTTSYKSINQFDKALETLDNACTLEPDSIDLLTEKTDLLVLLDRPQAAEASLEHALNVHPENKMLHKKMALFYRKIGEITKALSKAEELVAMHLDEPQSSDALAARALAAELARALLQHNYAISILENQSTIETNPASGTPSGELTDPDISQISPISIPYFCLLAEIALEHDEDVSAAHLLTKVFGLVPDHPRVLALQSRLHKRSGDHRLAEQTFNSALEAIEPIEPHLNEVEIADDQAKSPAASDTETFHQEICNLLAVAEAAGEIKRWQKWFDILETVVTQIPNEPFVYIQLARALTLRAEYQDFCQKLGVINNIPGDIAVSADNYQTFKDNLETAEIQFKSANKKRQLDETIIIKRWRNRGDSIFQSNSLNPQSLEELIQDSDDLTEIITSIAKEENFTGIHDIYIKLKESYDIQSLNHLSLARIAYVLACGCLEQEDMQESLRLNLEAIQLDSNEPLYHALLAKIAYKQGDNEVANQSIGSALATWPNEPRWHAFAAQINISEGDISEAINHLKIAGELEPDHLPHQLALGECLQKTGEFRAAIQTLKSARDIEPNNIGPVLGLARAYLSIGEFEQASSFAQSAVNKSPNDITPILVCADVAIQAGNIPEAQKYVINALRIDSQNAEALKMNSQVLRALGRFDEALETLEDAICIAEKPLKLMLERVDLVATTQGAEAALENLQELAIEYPEEPEVLYHLAKALAADGQNDPAILAAQKALRCDAFSLNTKELSQIHYLLGQLMRQEGQLDQAIYQLNKSIRLTPIYLEPYLELGRAHQERRQHAQSLQTYQKAITMAPDDPRPYCQAGLLLKESHDYQGAESMLRRAADLSPDDLSIHRQLGALIALNIVHNRRAIPKA